MSSRRFSSFTPEKTGKGRARRGGNIYYVFTTQMHPFRLIVTYDVSK